MLFLLFISAGAGLRAANYAMGADLPFLKQAEDRGTVFHTPAQLPDNPGSSEITNTFILRNSRTMDRDPRAAGVSS